jgi:hypothetical protein
MSPIHLGIGAAIAAIVIAGFAALQLDMPPDAQRLVVKNDFADAKCRMDFVDGAFENFSVAKGDEHRKTYKSPREGFINMRCLTAGKTIEIPGSFHMRNGELTRLTLIEVGTVEYAYERKR